MGKIFKNKKGFTLVELLAVVVVLAIVGAIAMQAISSIIQNNRIDSFISSINTVDEAAALSCAQNEDFDDTEEYVDKRNDAISVNPLGNTVEIKGTGGGEYKGISGDEVMKRAYKSDGKTKDKYKGHGTLTCTSDSKPASCTITYTNCSVFK